MKHKRTNVLVKVIAIGAVWSIAFVIGWRLRHPLVELFLVAIGASVSYLIWTNPGEKGD